jgi:hypothetical protein
VDEGTVVSEESRREWDVYRNARGEAVTVTDEQCAAIRRAARVWLEVCEAEGYREVDAVRAVVDALIGPTLLKSCLMGRMLYEGKPPTEERPPTMGSAPAYYLVDPDLCPTCGGERNGPGRRLGSSPLEDDASWHVRLAELAFAWKDGERYEIPIGKVRVVVECVEPWHLQWQVAQRGEAKSR